MKRARIAVGVVIIGAFAAFLLSWPNNVSQKPIQFKTVPTINYDKVIPNQIITIPPYASPIITGKIILAYNGK